jgi:nucleotide-binding universal stress UspA family protein
MNRHRILVAYDGTEPAFWALQRAADHAAESDAQIGVVTVGVGLSDAVTDARRYLHERGLQPDVHTPVGRPAPEIARVADEGAYHTVYLGSRDGVIGRDLESSVSRAVAVRSPLSVMIAR